MSQNPYDSPSSEPAEPKPTNRKAAKLLLPAMFVAIHTLAVLNFASTNIPLMGPDSDAGAMRWLMWMYVDFPLGFVAIFASELATTNQGAIAWILFIGGIQWALWGWLLWWILGFLQRIFNHRSSQS